VFIINVYMYYIIYTLGFGVAMLNIHNQLHLWDLIYIYVCEFCNGWDSIYD